MGITGSVRCTCFEDGKATPPPVPVRVDEHDEIHAVDPASSTAVLDWLLSACEHPWMAAAELSLGWAWVRSLREALADAGGAARYPVLSASLPEWNGASYLTPTEAATALEELRRFTAAVHQVAVDRLVPGGGGRHRFQTRHGSPEWMRTAAPGLIGLTGRGTFAVWGGPDVATSPLFESARFTQRVLDDGVELTDLDSGTKHRLAHGIAVDGEHPVDWEVQRWVIDAEQAYPQLEPLRDLFETAVAIGHHAELG